MDDMLFIGMTIYLMLSVLVTGLLPDDLFNASAPSTQSALETTKNEFQNSFNQSGFYDNPENQKGFLLKGLQFTFFTWSIPDIPAVVTIPIFLLNWVVVVIGGVYIYDKIRGI